MFDLLITIAFVATAPLLLADIFSAPDGQGAARLGWLARTYLVALVAWAVLTWLI